MIKQALGENSEFSGYHPVVNLLYFLLAIGITMFTMHPLFLTISFVCSWAYSILLGGKKAIKRNTLFMIPIILLMTLINTFFTHNGATVLFYLNDNRITLEALLYGVVTSLMLTAVIVWFGCFNVIMDSEKLVYLFGRAAPILGLTLSMIFRFIPLLKSRYREIHEGQRCMGRGVGKSIPEKVRQFLKEVSILISWSLESSIETADSMEARGYGLHGRTSFNLFKFTTKDITMLLLLILLGGVTIAGLAMGAGKMNFYPIFDYADIGAFGIMSAVSYCVLLLFPAVIDVIGEQKWQQLK